VATVQTVLKETLTTQRASIQELRSQNKSHAAERRTLQHENTQLLNAGTSRAKFDLMKNQVESLTSSLTEMTIKLEEYEKEKNILRNTGYTSFTAYCTALNTERNRIQPLVDIGRSVRSRLLELQLPSRIQSPFVLQRGIQAISSGSANADALLYSAILPHPREDIYTYANTYGFPPTAVLNCKSKRLLEILDARVWV
jgi:hypothetical protein